MITTIIIPGLILFTFLGLVIWVSKRQWDQSQKDWAEMNKLKERSNSVVTTEEIKTLHNDLMIFVKKLNNVYIMQEVKALDGYLRGLYKNAPNDK